jgi:GntR family negative regulator for fad regulon and positive regulator of fabA
MTTYQLNPKTNATWRPISKPAEIAESRLIKAIVEGIFPVNSHLPGERELAESIGVTRPTLREALQRLERDGWVEIHHGKPTRVKNYLKEGSLGVLNTLSRYPEHLPDNFVTDLLTVRVALAPTYTAMAVENSPADIITLLKNRHNLNDDPQACAPRTDPFKR